MITLNQLAMVYGSKLLFADVNLKLENNQRYALVGANGAGKSTLLKLLTGEETASDGSVAIPKAASIGWLKQDQYRYERTNIVDVVIQGKPALWQALTEKATLLATTELSEEAGFRLASLEETIAHHQGYTAQAFAEKLLVGLGVAAQYHQQPLSVLSGGYKLRVLLAQTLFSEPDILLLDEPTNHLDILSIAWLERYLKSEFSGLLVFISHDVEFVNRLADKIIDIDYGELREYSGNYQKFLAEKQLVEEQILHERKHVEEKIAQLQQFVDRFRYKASKARQAQSKAKQIEKMELPEIKQSSRIAPVFSFSQQRPSGKDVLKVEHLSKAYDDNIVLLDVNLTIRRGEKVALIGANGRGKSTLLKCIVNKVAYDEGQCEWGHAVQFGYFSQVHHDDLNQHVTVLDWLTNAVAQVTTQQARNMLGKMLFTKDEVEKDILALSGGEAARLLLARIMLQQPNVLLLDEPTNHLDIETTESLAKGLQDYPGTVLVVSHNRDFLKHMASRVLYLAEDGMKDFHYQEAKFESLING